MCPRMIKLIKQHKQAKEDKRKQENEEILKQYKKMIARKTDDKIKEVQSSIHNLKLENFLTQANLRKVSETLYANHYTYQNVKDILTSLYHGITVEQAIDFLPYTIRK